MDAKSSKGIKYVRRADSLEHDVEDDMDEVETRINNIINGTITVGRAQSASSASSATNATNATTAQNFNTTTGTIQSTFATKAGFYTGDLATNTNYPVGTMLFAFASPITGIRSLQQNVQVYPNRSEAYTGGYQTSCFGITGVAASNTLPGVWRNRGVYASGVPDSGMYVLCQRVS